MNEIVIPEIEQHLHPHNNNTFQCRECDHPPFISQSGLRYHTLKKHGTRSTNLGDHTCPECGYMSSKSGVRLHRSLKHGIPGAFRTKAEARRKAKKRTGKEFGCSYCEFRSGTKGGITRHMKNQHANETGYAVIGKPTTSLTNQIASDARSDRMWEKVMAMVAEKIYNKLMEEM